MIFQNTATSNTRRFWMFKHFNLARRNRFGTQLGNLGHVNDYGYGTSKISETTAPFRSQSHFVQNWGQDTIFLEKLHAMAIKVWFTLTDILVLFCAHVIYPDTWVSFIFFVRGCHLNFEISNALQPVQKIWRHYCTKIMPCAKHLTPKAPPLEVRTKHSHYTDCWRTTEKFDSCCKYWVPTISSSLLVLTSSITCVWELLLRQEPTDHGVESRQALLNIIQRQLCRVRVHRAVTHARRLDVASVCVWRHAIAS